MVDSIRQRIITNRVDMLRASGLCQRVEDVEPWEYQRGPFPRAWVVEGDEEFDFEALESKVNVDLRLVVQVAYLFQSSDPQRTLYRQGRQLIAQLEKVWMADFKCGGLAKISLPQGNSIGTAADQTVSIGIVTTWWGVRYLRNNMDPFRQ